MELAGFALAVHAAVMGKEMQGYEEEVNVGTGAVCAAIFCGQ